MYHKKTTNNFSKYNVKITFKPRNKIVNILYSTKDLTYKLNEPGVYRL